MMQDLSGEASLAGQRWTTFGILLAGGRRLVYPPALRLLDLFIHVHLLSVLPPDTRVPGALIRLPAYCL